MKILITGASGFVGGCLFQRARALGWEARGIGRRPMSDVDYRALDLTKPVALEFNPDVVVHAAARSSPWGSRREFAQQNVLATRHVLDFCATHGRPQLIYISTGAVLYRNEHQLGMDEQTPFPRDPVNEYAGSKILGEQLVRAYPGDWCILRPRAVFGPGDTVVFPRILQAIRRGKLPLIEADRPIVGDLIFIDTLIDYIIRTVERRATGVYNITNDEPVEIYKFLSRLCADLGLPAPTRKVRVGQAMLAAGVVEGVYRWLPFLGEPPITRFGVNVFAWSKTFNVSKALRDLGPPSVSLDEGLQRFIAWQRQQTMAA